jgi:hypothetical protein
MIALGQPPDWLDALMSYDKFGSVRVSIHELLDSIIHDQSCSWGHSLPEGVVSLRSGEIS